MASGGRRRVSQGELHAIEKRLLQLGERVRNDRQAVRERKLKLPQRKPKHGRGFEPMHENARHEDEEGKREEPQHELNERREEHGEWKDEEQNESWRHKDAGHDIPDNDFRGEDGHGGDRLALRGGGRHRDHMAAPPILVISVIGLILIVAYFVAKKVRKQRTRSYQSID